MEQISKLEKIKRYNNTIAVFTIKAYFYFLLLIVIMTIFKGFSFIGEWENEIMFSIVAFVGIVTLFNIIDWVISKMLRKKYKEQFKGN